jgi:hypothetical protein
MSYGDATEALQELGQIEISENSVWRLTQEWGEVLKQVEEKETEQANARDEPSTVGCEKAKMDVRLGASLDGCMINVRREGWKELKCGCFFNVEWATSFDTATKEMVEIGHATHTSYLGHLGGPEAFGRKLWSEARRRHWHAAVDTQVVADGAAWIWNLVADYLYDAHQLVDWYHATEHLWLASNLAFGEGSSQALSWFKQQENPLYQGHIDQVVRAITDLAEEKPSQREELLKQVGYFENHRHRMNYLDMRSEGWVIGSGMVESGAKRFKDRFTKAGMRWSRTGAERLLPIRVAVMSDRFNDRWRFAYNSPPI